MSFPLTSYWWPSRIAKPDVDEAREVLSSGREGQHLGTMKPSPMRVLPQGLWKGKIRASSPTSPFGETKPALRLHSALGRDHRGHLISEWLKDGTWSQTSWVQTLALPFLGPKTLDTLFNFPETQLSFSTFKMGTIIPTSETDWEKKSDKTQT